MTPGQQIELQWSNLFKLTCALQKYVFSLINYDLNVTYNIFPKFYTFNCSFHLIHHIIFPVHYITVCRFYLWVISNNYGTLIWNNLNQLNALFLTELWQYGENYKHHFIHASIEIHNAKRAITKEKIKLYCIGE